jgi:hypothetical protein
LSWDDAQAGTYFGIIPGSGNLIPDWVGANSRFALLREFVPKGLIYLTIFAGKLLLREENRRNSRFNRKNREFAPPADRPRRARHRPRVGDVIERAVPGAPSLPSRVPAL